MSLSEAKELDTELLFSPLDRKLSLLVKSLKTWSRLKNSLNLVS